MLLMQFSTAPQNKQIIQRFSKVLDICSFQYELIVTYITDREQIFKISRMSIYVKKRKEKRSTFFIFILI
uniref:Uncharacterized protein n=1 Tax=Anguilla anguilla TaxID=7936 RepID=A0A0E9WSQ7_ANGAN